jgi:hypothetical protein
MIVQQFLRTTFQIQQDLWATLENTSPTAASKDPYARHKPKKTKSKSKLPVLDHAADSDSDAFDDLSGYRAEDYNYTAGSQPESSLKAENFARANRVAATADRSSTSSSSHWWEEGSTAQAAAGVPPVLCFCSGKELKKPFG